MSFPNSPGVYGSIVDRSYVVSGSGLMVGAIVVTATKGPVVPTMVTSITQLIDMYGEPSSVHPSLYCAERFLRRAGLLNVCRVVTSAIAAQGALTVTTGGTTETILEVKAANPGTWGNNIAVSFTTLATEGAGVFRMHVKYNGVEVETFDVSRNPNAKNGYGANIFIENVVNTGSNYVRVSDKPLVAGDYQTATDVALTGGTNDTVAPSDGVVASGWDNFADENAQPAEILINAGWATSAVANKMVAIAAGRKNCRAILDVPFAARNSVVDMVSYRNTGSQINNYLAALYGGWVKIDDPYTGAKIDIPPSGDVAAAFVQTVTNDSYWAAPAGNPNGVILGAIGVSKIFTESEMDLMYTSGINPVTAYDGNNAVIMGQRNLQRAASSMDRCNVVNNVLDMRINILNALKPFVFKNNTAFMRQNVDYLIRNYLTNRMNRGGLYGFEVDVSEAINTPYVIDNKQMLVRVYVQPTQVSEFIKVDLIITPTGVQFV